MPTSPVPQWAQEMSPHHRGPTGAGVLRLAVLVVLVPAGLLAASLTGRTDLAAPDPAATVRAARKEQRAAATPSGWATPSSPPPWSTPTSPAGRPPGTLTHPASTCSQPSR